MSFSKVIRRELQNHRTRCFLEDPEIVRKLGNANREPKCAKEEKECSSHHPKTQKPKEDVALAFGSSAFIDRI
jgi:hypothetical protein